MNRKRHCPSCKCQDAEAVAHPPPVRGARWIPLTKGQFMLIDTADYEAVSAWSWYSRPAPHGNYAAHWGVIPGHKNRAKNIFLHHFLMGTRQRIDHVNGNGLDNRRKNLRLCSHSQNMANRRKFKGASSQFKGVCAAKHLGSGRWIAYINKEGRRFHLGVFTDEAKAARAYDFKAKELFGEFARLNFPNGQAGPLPPNILMSST